MKARMLNEVHSQLERISASSVGVGLDAEFEPAAGELLKIEVGPAYWHLPVADFLQLLKDLPAGAGPEGVKAAIEKDAPLVWHGPAPEGSRDTSP